MLASLIRLNLATPTRHTRWMSQQWYRRARRKNSCMALGLASLGARRYPTRRSPGKEARPSASGDPGPGCCKKWCAPSWQFILFLFCVFCFASSSSSLFTLCLHETSARCPSRTQPLLFTPATNCFSWTSSMLRCHLLYPALVAIPRRCRCRRPTVE